MIRRYHRWLAVLFGAFVLFIVVTGLMSHAAAIVAEGEPQSAAAPPGFICPETMTCRPKPDPNGARAWVGYLHHLHSGEEFGPAGTTVAIATGLALLFFAISGLTMYVEMVRARAAKARAGKPPRGGTWLWP